MSDNMQRRLHTGASAGALYNYKNKELKKTPYSCSKHAVVIEMLKIRLLISAISVKMFERIALSNCIKTFLGFFSCDSEKPSSIVHAKTGENIK